MQPKRKCAELLNEDECSTTKNLTKRLKSAQQTETSSEETTATQLSRIFALNHDEFTNTLEAFEFLCQRFNRNFLLPPIVHSHQLYSLFKNKTQVDHDIESLRLSKHVLTFKCGNELAICSLRDFHNYINKLLSQSEEKIQQCVQAFLRKILFETSALSIEKSVLYLKYKLTENEISTLVRMGLLLIKDPSHFWFAIPNIGRFRRTLHDARKSLVDVLKKKKYKEMSLDELKCRNMKHVQQLGVLYVLSDLIGSEQIVRVDSPLRNSFTFKLN